MQPPCPHLVLPVFSLCCVVLAMCIPACASSDDATSGSGPAIPPGVHAFYYLWYGNPEGDGRFIHWNHTVLPHWQESVRARWPEATFKPPHELHSPYYPQLGPYSSRDAGTLEQHMQWARQAGVDTFVASWWGRPGISEFDSQGVDTDAAFPMLLAAAQRHGIQVAIHHEPYAGRTIETIRGDLEYLIDKYGAHPALLRTSDGTGRPVVYFYDSYHLPPQAWKQLLSSTSAQSIRNTRLDVYAVGLWLHRDHGVAIHRGSFDAAYSYFAATRFSYGSTPGNWGTMSEFAKAHGFSLIPCAGPGYDDRRIRPWNTNAFRDRAGGKYYKDMFRAAIQTTTTGIVAITSWNEFGEGTNIEPCVPYTVPEGAGFPPQLRRQLNLQTQYLDFRPQGPMFFLDLTASLRVELSRRWPTLAESAPPQEIEIADSSEVAASA